MPGKQADNNIYFLSRSEGAGAAIIVIILSGEMVILGFGCRLSGIKGEEGR